MHYVYIIYSKTLNRFYAGETSNIEDRLKGHVSNKNKYTGKAKDWVLVWKTELPDRKSALVLEKKIKHRGIRRFLEENKIDFVL
ncbi:MAG TPA: GIY-YIG nuclease family protein [Ignavibacteria bacterium]|nr:GIY-YIG nuclease family protein [Ignavibacteria bacterium]